MLQQFDPLLRCRSIGHAAILAGHLCRCLCFDPSTMCWKHVHPHSSHKGWLFPAWTVLQQSDLRCFCRTVMHIHQAFCNGAGGEIAAVSTYITEVGPKDSLARSMMLNLDPKDFNFWLWPRKRDGSAKGFWNSSMQILLCNEPRRHSPGAFLFGAKLFPKILCLHSWQPRIGITCNIGFLSAQSVSYGMELLGEAQWALGILVVIKHLLPWGTISLPPVSNHFAFPFFVTSSQTSTYSWDLFFLPRICKSPVFDELF